MWQRMKLRNTLPLFQDLSFKRMSLLQTGKYNYTITLHPQQCTLGFISYMLMSYEFQKVFLPQCFQRYSRNLYQSDIAYQNIFFLQFIMNLQTHLHCMWLNCEYLKGITYVHYSGSIRNFSNFQIRSTKLLRQVCKQLVWDLPLWNDNSMEPRFRRVVIECS